MSGQRAIVKQPRYSVQPKQMIVSTKPKNNLQVGREDTLVVNSKSQPKSDMKGNSTVKVRSSGGLRVKEIHVDGPTKKYKNSSNKRKNEEEEYRRMKILYVVDRDKKFVVPAKDTFIPDFSSLSMIQLEAEKMQCIERIQTLVRDHNIASGDFTNEDLTISDLYRYKIDLEKTCVIYASVEQKKQFFMVGLYALEIAMNAFGVRIDGFAEAQMKIISTYSSTIFNIEETKYNDRGGDPTIRNTSSYADIGKAILMNSGVFLIVAIISGRSASSRDMIDTTSQFSSLLGIEKTDDQDRYGNIKYSEQPQAESGGIMSSIMKILSGDGVKKIMALLGGGGGDTKPIEKEERKKRNAL